MNEQIAGLRRLVPQPVLWTWIAVGSAVPLLWVWLDPLSEPAMWGLRSVPGSWAVFKVIYCFGKFETHALLLLGGYLLLRRVDGAAAKRLLALGFIVLIIGGSVVTVTKLAVRRQRPQEVARTIQATTLTEEITTGKCMSFPSGDTEAAFALACVLAAFSIRLRILCFSMASLVGLSRVYFGCHYFSDVVAGGLLGTIVATVTLGFLYHRRGQRPVGEGSSAATSPESHQAGVPESTD